MTSVFKKIFQGKSTQAQAVETKKGSWKSKMDKDERLLFRTAAAIKGASVVAMGAAVLTLNPIAIGLGCLGFGMYSAFSSTQSNLRTKTENPGARIASKANLKNIARYLVQPF